MQWTGDMTRELILDHSRSGAYFTGRQHATPPARRDREDR